MSLVSTLDLRLWMSIEEGDKTINAKLAYIARAVEDFCDSYTNRRLKAQTYTTDPQFSYLDGKGYDYIYTPQYPVSYVSEVNIDSSRDFTSSTALDSTDFFWYPNGKIISEGGNFLRGRRNIRLSYIAGYAPVVGGTHSMAVSTYPIPEDLKQVMVEMCVESVKEGMTAVHSIDGEQPRFIQMLKENSFWKNVLNKNKAFDASLVGD